MDKMKVFTAWSGNSSKRIAQILREWLPQVLPFVEVWMSEEDIPKGTLWSTELWENLREADFGILCLVSRNVAEHWVIFEAGVLSGGRARERVSPFLFDIDPDTLPTPLRQFECTRALMKDVLRLVDRLNALAGDGTLNKQELIESFRKHWERLHRKLKAVDVSRCEEDTEDASQNNGQTATKEIQLDDAHLSILRMLVSSRSRLGWELRTRIERVVPTPRRLLFIKLKDLIRMGFVVEGSNRRGWLFYRISEQGVRYLDAKGLISR